MKPWLLLGGLLASLAFSPPLPAADVPNLAAAPKVILDTDFNTIGDDGQVLAMAAQLMAEGRINLLGVTVVSGNQWLEQELADALKAVERLGIQAQVPVYRGAQYPLLHDYQAFRYQRRIFGGFDYVGAYASPPPTGPEQLTPPPDGFATQTTAANKSAVRFLIQTLHQYPHEVSILAIGPLTNLALAFREDPSVIPLVKQIVYMGGQVDTVGNAFTDAGEFNWWFDAEAVKVVLRADIPHVVVPLDVTNTVPLTRELFGRVTGNPARQTIITRLFEDNFSSFFGDAPPSYLPYIYDTIALAVLLDPSLATDVRVRYLDINTNADNVDYGKVTGFYANLPTKLLQPVRVVFHIDIARFENLYVDLLTRPVPVRLSAP